MFSVGDTVKWYEVEYNFVGTVTEIKADKSMVKVLWDDGLHSWQSNGTLLPYDRSEYEVDE